MLPLCRELRDFNSRQIESSEQVHRQTFPWLAWGLAAVGGIGSIAGLVLGYGVARGLSHSIYQLSVRVRDAADKLGQDLPTVTLQEDGDLTHLHQQLQGMVQEIEQVVNRLQQRDREVLRAEQLAAVGQIAAGVAHELRNPLTSIKLLVQTSQEEAVGRGLPSEDLEVIEREIRRMERCLQTFLDFARPPKTERKPLALQTVVDRTLELIAGRAKKQGVDIQVSASAAPLIVEADAEQLRQVLVNLTLNALDAMPRGGRLEIDELTPSPGWVEVRIADTGPGVASQIATRLFEPFVSGKETGLGLGLVISRRIVENHGGTLTAASDRPHGACFVMRLPLSEKPFMPAAGHTPAAAAAR
jgi:signal transduction histidine kinase